VSEAVDGGVKRIEVYTDGGARPNPGPGGWGVVVLRPGAEPQELSGGEEKTTNNRMELTAAIRALEALTPGEPATVFTDSQYLRRGITEWISGWVARGWKRKGGGAVENDDLWRRLASLDHDHRVDWKWLRGHSGHRWNERADELASAEVRRQGGGSTGDEDSGADHQREIFLRISAHRGRGGWAALLREGGDEEQLAGSARGSGVTANRLDVLAAAELLEKLPTGGTVAVWSGSDYLRLGASQWIHGWRKRSWKTRDGKPVANRDAWERLDAAARRHGGVAWPQPGEAAAEIFKALDKRAREAREEA